MKRKIEPKIYYLRDDSSQLNEVLQLHRENASTLGFLPEIVFKESLLKEQLIVAEINEVIAGYLLYDINKKYNFIRVVHLCISSKFRNLGVAKKLSNFLIELSTPSFNGIKINCRRDYKEATKLWKDLGFVKKTNRPGRSKKGSIIDIWWYSFNTEDLFTGLYNNDNLKVVLDSNIIYSLMDNSSEEYKFLQADWIDNVEYFVTEELSHEVDQSKDDEERNKSLQFINKFPIIVNNNQHFQKTVDELKQFYKSNITDRDKADIRHIARTINSDAKYFITNDQRLLSKAVKISNKFEIEIITPIEFIRFLVYERYNHDYSPQRFAETKILLSTPRLEELQGLLRTFHCDQEKLRVFNKRLSNAIVNQHKIYQIISDHDPLAIYTVKESRNELIIEFLRTKSDDSGITLLNQIIHNIIIMATEKKLEIIIITEKYLNEHQGRIIKEFGFLKQDDQFIKYVKNGLYTTDEIESQLDASNLPQKIKTEYKNLLKKLTCKDVPNYEKLQLEKFFFPLKFSNLGIKCYVISIMSKWAMNLFSTKIGEQFLFGGKEELIFNRENVYYSGAINYQKIQHSRLLWYIKQEKYLNCTKAICAASYINEAIVDYPKKLFKRFERLGVYSWENVKNTAKNNLDNKILAFNFDLTINFNVPVDFEVLNSIFLQTEQKDFTGPQSPIEIKETTYFEIYKKGFEL